MIPNCFASDGGLGAVLVNLQWVDGESGLCEGGVGPERANRTYLKESSQGGGFRPLMLRSLSFSLILVFGAAGLPAQEQGKTPAKELTQYVRDAQKAGLKDAEIQQYAVKSGWPEPLVKEAIEYVRATPKAQVAKAESQPATLPIATAPVANPPAATAPVAAAPAAVVEEKPALPPATPAATPRAEPRNPDGAEPGHAASAKPTARNRGAPEWDGIGADDVMRVGFV